MSLAEAVLVFAVAAVFVAGAGVRLARAGDELAERSRLSGLFVGMLLLAAATSLPELVTVVSASLADNPDLAVGDLFGASMANMATLAIIDLLGRQRIWPTVEVGHARVASVAIGLAALATLGVLTAPGVGVAGVGVGTVVIAALYVGLVAWMRRSPTGRFGEGGVLPVPAPSTDAHRRGLAPVALRLALAAAVIFAAAPTLAWAAAEIADASGLGQTFVGTALLAVTTSLPELVSSITAVRLGAHDLAVGNLFGSNAFNMFGLVFADVAYRPGPLLDAVDASQAVAGVGTILLMSVALSAIVHGTETRLRRLEPDAVFLLLVYVGALFAVWSVRP